MGGSTKAAGAVNKLDRAVGGKFNGLKYDVRKRTVQSIIRMCHSAVSDILERRPCPEPVDFLPRTTSAMRRPTRSVTCSQVVDKSTTQPGTGGAPPADQDKEDQSSPSCLSMRHQRSRHHHLRHRHVQSQHQFLSTTDDNVSNLDDIQN